MANYLIIGGDGKEYGPVTEADVRQWIAESRLNEQTKAKAESDAEFRPLSAFPEFAEALGQGAAGHGAPGRIAPLPGSASAGYQRQDYDLDIGGCVSRGFQLLKDYFSLLFVAALVYLAIEGFLALLSAIPIIGPIFSITNLVIAGPLTGGLMWVFILTLRGQPAEVGDVFAGFRRNFGQLFLGKLIPGLLAGLCFIPFVITAVLLVAVPSAAHHRNPTPEKILILIPIGLVCLIPVIYLQTCWTFTLPLIIDRQMDFAAAMKASWRMVNKHWWQVFGLVLLVGLINIAGVLACFVGTLFTIPIGIGAMMCAYETIFGDRQ